MNCNKCHAVPITFDRNKVSKSGKLIPLDAESLQPHRCTVSSPFPCKYCNENIYLDQRVKSKNDRQIPLSFTTNAPHNCPKKPTRSFFKNGGFDKE